MSNWQSQALAVWASLLISFTAGVFLDRWLQPAKRTRKRLTLAALVVPLLVLGWPWVFDSTRESLEREASGINLGVVLYVRNGTSTWTRTTRAQPGDTVEYQLHIWNDGPGTARNVAAGVNLAPFQSFVPNTVKLKNSNNPIETDVLDQADGRGGQHLFTGGIDIGHYEKGANAYIYWQMAIDEKLAPGPYRMHSVGIGRAAGHNAHENVATVQIDVPE